MIRILTILLLPLLFIATSCDSGGDGTACAINPTGLWKFTEYNLDFSDECTCSDGDCNDLYGGSILDEVSCIHPDIGGGFILWNTCECYSNNRGMTNCNNYDTNANQYSCEDNQISLKHEGSSLYHDDKWIISDGNDTATITIEESIEDFILGYYVSGSGIYMPIWSDYNIDQSALDFGDECTVTTTASLANCGSESCW